MGKGSSGIQAASDSALNGQARPNVYEYPTNRVLLIRVWWGRVFQEITLSDDCFALFPKSQLHIRRPYRTLEEGDGSGRSEGRAIATVGSG